MARPIAIRARTRATARRSRRAAARTGLRSRSRPPASASYGGLRGAECFGSFRAVEPFYVAGGLLAAWALIVTAIGVRSEDFPATPGATRLVGAISIVLVVTAIGLAIYLSATEDEEKSGEEHAALTLWG